MASSGTIREVAVPAVQRIAVEELPGHLATLEAELTGGRAIQLVRGGVVVAEVRGVEAVPAEVTTDAPRVLPDFMGRMKETWGDKVFPEGTGTRWVREDRDARG